MIFFGKSGTEKRLKAQLDRIELGIKFIMATQAELAGELKALKDQQNKIAREQSDRFDAQLAKIAELEEAIKNAPVSEEVTTALAELKEATQALDDTIPDAPAPDPTEPAQS